MKTEEIQIFDITSELQDFYKDDTILKAEVKVSDILILRKIKPTQALNGNRYAYQIEHRWLSKSIENKQDIENENYVCVMGQDYILTSKKETKMYKTVSLFKMFNLF